MKKSKQPVLLAGGNPQIAKGDGDAPVQEYLGAMPGRKQAVGRRLDALITRSVTGVRKAVKWNSPFYGVDGWIVSFHCFTRYVKVSFFDGAQLRPLPPRGIQAEPCSPPGSPRRRLFGRSAVRRVDEAGQ